LVSWGICSLIIGVKTHVAQESTSMPFCFNGVQLGAHHTHSGYLLLACNIYVMHFLYLDLRPRLVAFKISKFYKIFHHIKYFNVCKY